MKKTLTRFLLSICMVAILVSCLGATAFAADTVKHTVAGGETVLGICNKLGVDFYRNQAWITSANKITNYNNVPVGKVLVLPLFDTVADPTRANKALADAGTATASTTATTATTTPAASTTAGMTGLHAGDTVISYLVNHTMAAGETVGAICAQLGVNFGANADTIKALSGITNYYKIPVGKVVVIPCPNPPAGSTFTAIVGHKVVGGETVTSICNSYGVNYGKIIPQLKALNSTDNLNVIRVGQTFYLPVVGSAVTPSTTPGTTPSTTPSTTPTPTPDTTTTSALKVNSAAHGTFTLTINGKEVQTATSGQTVKVVAQPDTGYKVSTISVKRTDTNADVAVNNSSFVMPNAPVTVSVTFVTK